MELHDHDHLRTAITVAAQARQHGNHPFGAVLVAPDGQVLLEAENTVVTTGDVTDHAELNLVRLAAQRFDRDLLASCTLYASTEPCAMCAGAIYWASIGRLVFALSGAQLVEMTKDNHTNDNLLLPCRDVFAHGQRLVEVVGPLLEDEAKSVHEDFWKSHH